MKTVHISSTHVKAGHSGLCLLPQLWGIRDRRILGFVNPSVMPDWRASGSVRSPNSKIKVEVIEEKSLYASIHLHVNRYTIDFGIIAPNN